MKIGIDIGGSHIGVGLVDEKGNIIKKVETDIQAKENIQEEIVSYVDDAISNLMKIGDITSIGIAAPGNPSGHVINNLVNLGIDTIDFHQIEEKYKIKIKSINDAKAAALAEKEYGVMKKYQDAVFLCLGTGIGGAVFLNNKLLQSNRNPGFELGHIVIDRKGTVCNCGKKGCFETYCSIKRWKEKMIEILEQIDENISIEHASDIITYIKQNKENKKIQEQIEEYINDLIIGLSNIIDIFEPEIITLGGSFIYFNDIFYTKLLEEMDKKRYVFNKEILPKIQLASLGNDGGIIGSTLL